MNGLDLSGKIIFKVKFDNEIKKIIIHNDEINHNELLLMIQRIFSEKIKPNDELIIKYTDEENDLITIANDSDVTLALQTSKIVKLTVYLDEKENNTNNAQEEGIKASEVIKELQNIRTSIDKFLDNFERYLKLDKGQQKIDEITKNTNDVKLSGSSTTLINNDLHKEFDPLAKKIDSTTLEVPNASNASSAAQKFLPIQKNSRAETPDSIGSSEFSPNPKTKFPGQSNEINVAQSQPVPGSYGQDNQIHQQQHFNQPVQSLNQPQHFQQQQQQQQQQQSQIPAQNQYAASQGLKYPSQTSMMNQSQQYMAGQPQPSQPQYIPQPPQQQNTQQMAHPSQIPNQQMDPQLQNQYQPQQPPQPSQYYQQQNPNLPNPQQQQQPGMMQPGQPIMPTLPNPAQQTPPIPGSYTGFNMQTPNPYSQKNPNMALGRPPSATAHYQQGYK